MACEKGLAVWDWAWKYWHPKYALDHPEMKPSKRVIPASILYNDADRREFIGAGAAAGLAVSFMLPSLLGSPFKQELPSGFLDASRQPQPKQEPSLGHMFTHHTCTVELGPAP